MNRDKKDIMVFDKPDWGEYIKPNTANINESDALRVVLFGSTLGGMWVLEALKKLKNEYREYNLDLVGLVTDDARDDRARISLKKRIWHYFSPITRIKMVNAIIEMGLDSGMEVFTGNVKTTFFETLLHKWKPDVILMACFGQIVPISVFKYPRLGMYNFHPSDLKNNIGSGPRPFEDTISLGLSHARVSLMEVTEIVDHGPMVAISPPICITDENGDYFSDILITEEKVISVFPFMTEALIFNLMKFKSQNLESNTLKFDLENEIDISVKKYLLTHLTGLHNKFYPFPDLKMLEYFRTKA